MQKAKSVILWGLAALVCIVFLSFRSQAAEFKMGPGDHYDEKGNIVALDGTMLVTSDGTICKTEFNNSNSIPARSMIKSAESGKETQAKIAEVPTAKIVPNYTVADTSNGKIYSFEGKQYVKSGFYGEHRLTGYAAQETGSASTSSGKMAKAAHTVAAPSDLPIGTVIIVEGTSGPYASDYTGLYVVEDRGGEKLESEGLIDIFCNSIPESERVTAAGWNRADVWIAKAIR